MAKVVVVGGGIAGLGAAYALQKTGLDVVVLEAAAEAGGRVRSRQWQGAWIDLGAEFIAAPDLARFSGIIDDLGLRDQLIEFPGGKVAFEVWRDGQAHPLSFTEASSLLRFGGMSARGKAQLLRLLPALVGQFRRNGGDGFEPWRGAWCDDESVESWLGRVAPEFLEYAIEPAYELYCGWEPQDCGRGTLVYMTTAYRQTSTVSFKEGLGQLTRALAARLLVIPQARVTGVSANERPVTVDYERNGRRHRLTANYVIVAVPGSKVADMVSGLDAERRAFFQGIRYTPHEILYAKLSRKPEGVPTRVYYPRKEDALIAGIGYDQATTNASIDFLRVAMKTAFAQARLDEPDGAVAQASLNEATRRFPQIKPLVEDSLISRWREGLPVFWPGYLKSLERFIDQPAVPGVSFAGDYLAGPSTGAAYVSGQRAVAQAIQYLSATPSWLLRDTRDTREFPLFKAAPDETVQAEDENSL